MKKKILTVALVCAMMSATAITANAATITPDSTPKTGVTEVSYQVDPTYTITIPESVTLSKDSTVNADITAADVFLEKGKNITVTLTGASNTTTANATTFNAKNNTSVATYTITAGSTAVALGGEVASFAADGTQTLTFSAANTDDIIFAGAHTEQLTFTISIGDAAVSPKTLAEQVTTDNSVVRLNFGFTAGGKTSDVYVDYTYNSGTFTRTGKSEEFSPNGNWKMTESNGVLTFTAVYAPFGDFILKYSSTINLNDLTYSESNEPSDDADAKWYITLTNIEVNSTPVTITKS